MTAELTLHTLLPLEIGHHIFRSAPEVTKVVLSHQIKWGSVLGYLFMYSSKENNSLISQSLQESSGESNRN